MYGSHTYLYVPIMCKIGVFAASPGMPLYTDYCFVLLLIPTYICRVYRYQLLASFGSLTLRYGIFSRTNTYTRTMCPPPVIKGIC